MKKRREYPDDDGRTVADMSGLSPQPVFLPKLRKRETDSAPADSSGISMTNKEKGAYAFGALKAALLIGAVFAAAFALLIIVMLVVWEMQTI